MNGQLSLRRVGLLLRNDVLNGYRTLLIVSLMVALFMLIGAMSVAYNGGNPAGFYSGQFLGVLFIWGTLASSVAFKDLHRKSTNSPFLLLPASGLEKTLARFLYHSVGFIAFLLVFTTVVSFVAEGINLLVIGRRNDVFQPFNGLVWHLLPHYLVVQALFFAGAAWFRKAQWIKTMLVIAICLCAFVFLCIALAWVLGMASWTAGNGLTLNIDPYDSVYRPLRWFFDTVVLGVYYVALPAFCWFVAWLRVKETQVSHGI